MNAVVVSDTHRNNKQPKKNPFEIVCSLVAHDVCFGFDTIDHRRFAKDNNLTSFDTNHVTFTVVNSEQANAFVLPGNHVFVLTGLFKYAKTEDEIAGILVSSKS